MADLGPAVSTILERCLAIAPGENVLVIVDDATRHIGHAIRVGASQRGAEAVMAEMDERETHGSEPPAAIVAAMLTSQAIIAPTTKSLSHTQARKRATDAGIRTATMPGVTEDMLARVMSVDFDLMAARSRATAGLLTEGKVAHVTCPRGTQITLDIQGRSGVADDGDLTTPGSFGNLPCGEGFVSPIGGEGRIVASSLASLGISDPPTTLTVHDGKLVSAQDGLGPEYIAMLQAHGDAGLNLAELGVGTNDHAQLTGIVLEDEKILGTVHIAFGASAGIGGTVSVPIHLDVVVLDASLDVDGRPVLDAGRFVLDTA